MAATDPKKETVYNTKVLSKWFALSSIFLLLTVVWAVLEDYDREWKQYTRQFQKITVAINERKLAEAKAKIDFKKLADVEKQIADIRKELKDLTSEVDSAIKERGDDYYQKNQKFQFAKAEMEGMLFKLETAYKKLSPKAQKMQVVYDKKVREVQKLQQIALKAEAHLEEAKATKKEILKKEKELQDTLTAKTAERDRIQKVIAANDISLLNLARNAPVLDFISPTVKIHQVVLPHLKDDYFFNKVPRVDRCMTCHATAGTAGFEDYPQPYKTHPKLELIGGPDSAHPFEKVGCTVCHAGVPQSVDFSKSAHTPQSPEQEQIWAEKYGYYRDKHIGTPMIPTAMVEGRCIQCHASEVQLDKAPTFNAGMRLVERYGCYGCHKFSDHFEKLTVEKKPGPSLERLASKLDPEWVKKWLWDPKGFRPTTLMPSYWQIHNNSDPESMAQGAVEIDAITAFLFSKSKPYEPLKMASNALGDAERGKKLVGEVGCLGCHAVADFPRPEIKDPKVAGYKDPRIPMFGPELNQMGSKVSASWLYSWLIDPKHYWEGTAMPSMKLSSQEAADITEYLLSKRNSRFESLQAPEANDKLRDRMVRSYLEKSNSREEAKKKLASMALDTKKVFLGEKLVSHYGCYGCHAIEGFEKAPKIGADLSLEGSKDILKFDFANVQLPKTSRPDWVFTKIRTPRIWDVGKERDFESKTRMPHFSMNHEQAKALTAIVLGHEIKKVDDEAIQKVDARLEHVIAGHRLINQSNCVGCHAIENKGADVLAHYQADTTLGPPNLNTQGEKTQAEWLYRFLRNPDYRIRPFLDIRMPNFYLDDLELLTLTQYFAAYDRAQYPFIGKHYNKLSDEDYRIAEQIVTKQACLSCHGRNVEASAGAPYFSDLKVRLNGPWVEKWLKNPAAIMPGTRMPTLWPSTNEEDPHAPLVGLPDYYNGDAVKQIQVVRDYLFMNKEEPRLPSTPATKNVVSQPSEEPVKPAAR